VAATRARSILACAVLLSLACATASRTAPARPPGPEAVRTIPIYVTPYYASADAPGGRPQVGVGRDFDPLLSSSRREDVLRARDMVTRDPRLITPMTMMVLAIRLYDVGLRDDAVFWFYAARDRYSTMDAVLDLHTPGLAPVPPAIGSFVELAGPFIDGYAFCDVEKQRARRMRALEWVEQHPYLFEAVLRLAPESARPGNRAENLKAAIGKLRESAGKEREWLSSAENRASLQREREKNGAVARFCWE
jgi:hypothetical protein